MFHLIFTKKQDIKSLGISIAAQRGSALDVVLYIFKYPYTNFYAFNAKGAIDN